MDYDELRTRIRQLNKKKAAFARNRNFCAIGATFLAYNTYSTIKTESPPLWFYFAMGAIILTCVAVGIKGQLTIKKLDVEIEKLSAEAQNLQESESDTSS